MKTCLYIFLLFLVSCEITITDPLDPVEFNNGDSLLLNVSPLPNDYACVITTLGMWMQYWDKRYRSLMDNVSDIVNTQHVKYYAKPKDTQRHLLPDSSIIDNPPQTCLADFLRTSWYTNGCAHGATAMGMIVIGTKEYLEYKGDIYKLEHVKFKDFDSYVRALDQDRPVLLIVGTGNSVHAILGVGYVRSDSTYLVYDSFCSLRKHKWYSTCLKEDWIMITAMDLQLKYKT